MTKAHILSEIRRTTEENGGQPLGFRAFENETGIRYHDWFGKHWKAWGEALQEAGFAPNPFREAIAEDKLFEHYVRLVRDLGRVPVKGDLLLRRRADPTFPSDKVFTRCFGLKAQMQKRIHELCVARGGMDEVIAILAAHVTPARGRKADDDKATPVLGFVYLLRSGRYYKVGRTNAAGRRERELQVQLPEKANQVHVIKTDDPEGIEAYWHRRFAAKRANGEWFALDGADVAAFKRRKFQ